MYDVLSHVFRWATRHIPCAHKGQKRISDVLGLELQMFVSRMALSIEPRSSATIARALNC